MGEVERTVFLGSQRAGSPQRIVCANGRSKCDEEHDLPHPPTASLLVLQFAARLMKARARGDEPHSLDEHDCHWPLVSDSAHEGDILDSH
ncbi:MAG TPA: hypothetical protein VFB12_08140 [Ktedonobacteraceae bacterium]|nr:hypothetical protein [Ktedonobacteraceae bacterium]